MKLSFFILHPSSWYDRFRGWLTPALNRIEYLHPIITGEGWNSVIVQGDALNLYSAPASPMGLTLIIRRYHL